LTRASLFRSLAGETIDPRRLDSAESEIRALLYQEGDVVPLRKAAG